MHDLQVAVERGELVAHFQPQVDLSTGGIVACEALARWYHPELGPIPPGVFIRLAEESELIQPLGRLMLDQVLATASRWHKAGLQLEVSVNVSANQLASSDFFDDLEADLDYYHLEPHAVTLEITESQPILDAPAIAAKLAELSRQGLDISIDDYGVGYSSLQQLDAMPATELKLDLSLVQDNGVEALALMTAVVELAHWRGLRVVAEGVETESQLARVRELGCDRAQGFLFGKPMPRDEIERLVR